MLDGCICKLFLAVVILVNLLPGNTQLTGETCGTNTTCGSNSFCSAGGTCNCIDGFLSLMGSNTDCANFSVPNEDCTTSNCLYCPNRENCQKCITGRTLTSDGKSCVNNCPDGSSARLVRIDDTTIFASMCISQGDSSSEIPGVYIGVIVGVSAIVIVILVIMVVYCLYAFRDRRKQQRTLEISDENMNNEVLSHQNAAFLDCDAEGQLSENTEDDEDYTALADGDDEKAQFLRKLARLRKQSSIFLRMLNDMRRRLKELPQTATAAQSYKNVMQDVTRLLYLLNKKPHNVQMPPDGMQLLNWSEEILKRYLQSQQQRTNSARISTYGQQAETHF